jgi:hypothetical protein
MSETQPYKTTKDYKKVFALLKEGKELVAFVNYRFSSMTDEEYFRDVCRVSRRKAFDIDFRVRGLSYGSVSDFKAKSYNEFDLFKNQCEVLNTEFVEIN